MAVMAIKALLLSLLAGGLSASAASHEELQGAIEELQGLIKEQRERIGVLQKRSAVAKDRRLEDEKADQIVGLYGDTTGTRVYDQKENHHGALDHLWLLLCGALVMFMQAGFAMVESGMCRFKNVQNVLLKNLTDVCVGTLGWYFFGWSFAYSGPMKDGYKENRFAGSHQFAGHHFSKTRPDGQLEPTTAYRDWFFQWAFCSAAATIVSGGVAERVIFPGYLIFSFVMSSVIYPIVVAWSWGLGFLADMNTVGYMDFAGSGIVHMTGGIGALVGAAVAGPRTGRWLNNEGNAMSIKERVTLAPDAFNPHSMVLVVFGTFALWFGWYGFNCGSTLAMNSIETGFMAAQVAMNTTLAAAVGGLTVFAIRYSMTKKYDVGGFCNGILAGLVSITAGCGNVENATAVGIALFGAVIFQAASSTLRVAKIDDPVDAFAVHGACGAWGVLAAGFMDWGQGFNHVHAWSGFKCMSESITPPGATAPLVGPCKEGLGDDLIAAAFSEVAVIVLWVAALCGILFVVLKKLGLLVASSDMQEEGFDLLKHSPRKAYELPPPKKIPRTSI